MRVDCISCYLLSEDVSVPPKPDTWGEVATTAAYSAFAIEIVKGKSRDLLQTLKSKH